MTDCNQILPRNLTDLHTSFGKKKKRKKKGCAPQSKKLLKKHKVCAVSAPSGWLPRRRDRGATGSWCKEEMSGCLVPASSQMFCGSLCKPTCICLLAFQNVCYRCIHYGLGRSRTPSPPNKPRDCDGRYFNAEKGGGLILSNCWWDVVRLRKSDFWGGFLSLEKASCSLPQRCISIIYTM